MAEKKTVFIIGAGASKEVGMPLGDELKGIIAELLNLQFEYPARQVSGDRVLMNSLRRLAEQAEDRGEELNAYVRRAQHICAAMPQAISIDNFIDSQKGNNKIATCGKLAVVKAILEAERNSGLYFNEANGESCFNFEPLSQTWYNKFFQILTENCNKFELRDRFRSICLVIFNYDRCIEHFLFHSLRTYYNLDFEEILVLMDEIHIYHPYGKVGELDFSSSTATGGFGKELGAEDLIRVSSQIRTFTEGTDEASSEIENIHNCLYRAERVVFLGFAFHKLNMNLLRSEELKQSTSAIKDCYASTYKISNADQEIINERICSLFDPKFQSRLLNNTCSGFFDEYRLNLAF